MLTTKTDLIEHEIEPALGEYFNDYDIDSIIDEAYTFEYPDGYKQREDVDFWDIVSKHDVSNK
jgi:hypothetical protein